jgi:phage shock protein PspC (stress-responsive transcriptional regulator)
MSQKLTRSSDRIIAGVAGGIAKYLGVDASIVRIVTAAIVVFTGVGPLLYIVAWLILPEENTGRTGIDAITGGVKKAKESYDSNKIHNPNDLR